MKLDGEPRISQAKSNFETIKRFYYRLKSEQDAFLAHIQGIEQEAECAHYAALLLRRLMVLYFLQQRGFLDGQTDYLSRQLQHCQQTEGKDSFFRSFLLPLFHEQSGQPPSLEQQDARFSVLPPLNLFHIHALEAGNTPIQIPDKAFAELFTFFEEYQWQLTEQIAHDGQVLSPDVLAYICERHSRQKEIGAYYTKNDISSYIAQTTIGLYLLESMRAQYATAFEPGMELWQLLQREPDRYITAALQQRTYLPTESRREYQKRQEHFQRLHTLLQSGSVHAVADLLTYRLDILRFAQDMIATCTKPEMLLICYNTLESMAILDPTCGSGALLFAALCTLVPLYESCLARMQALFNQSEYELSSHADKYCYHILERVKQHPGRMHFILTTIITNNLFGVDMMPEAIEVCRLRLLLTVFAHARGLEDLHPLPALEQNLRCGNALVGSIHSPAQDDASYQANNHRPFHWSLEFERIMQRGGFDVIIGNPPYVEYSKVRQDYKVQGYETESCGNLYAAVVERSLLLCRTEQGCLGLIVPLSVCGSARFAALRETIMSKTARRWLANFEIFPSRLFDGAFQRLSILLAQHGSEHKGPTCVTKIQRWYAMERPHLIEMIHYTPLNKESRTDIFPKLAAPLQEIILHKIVTKARGSCIAHHIQARTSEHFVYYQEATNYWMKAVCSIPFYQKNGQIMIPPHGRRFFVKDERLARIIMAVMNSSLFYLWFATYSDGFHLSHTLVKDFPLSETLTANQELPLLSKQLEQNIKAHARLSTRNTRPYRSQKGLLIELEEYKMGYSKAILDEIDAVLAQQYTLTPEELDFIVHYDVKYRMREHRGVGRSSLAEYATNDPKTGAAF